MLGEEPYPAEAIAENGVIALTLPVSDFDHAMQKSHTFRNLVRKRFAKRLTNIIARMEQNCSPIY
jgi:signal-transduction protein with cAMP-binding, CBS, and nucleotidyltransferase domain